MSPVRKTFPLTDRSWKSTGTSPVLFHCLGNASSEAWQGGRHDAPNATGEPRPPIPFRSDCDSHNGYYGTLSPTACRMTGSCQPTSGDASVAPSCGCWPRPSAGLVVGDRICGGLSTVRSIRTTGCSVPWRGVDTPDERTRGRTVSTSGPPLHRLHDEVRRRPS